MVINVNGVQHWIREIPRHGYFVFREYLNRRPWIDPYWTQIAGPFSTEASAAESL